jgi:hypothetical protein
MKYYTLEDFDLIKREPIEEREKETEKERSKYLELSILLENLSNELGVSTRREVIIPVKPRNRSSGSYAQRQYSGTKTSEESWIQPKTIFKTTTIEKSKTTAINEIRICLNKMSTKNYETSKNSLLDTIKKTSAHELPAVAQHIFDIASTNKFFSEMYADLYKALLLEEEKKEEEEEEEEDKNKEEEEEEDYDFVVDIENKTSKNIFRDLLETFLSKFTETMHTIKYVDASDYDNFCEYNKLNDKRKATSLFIVNLTKKGVVEPGVFGSIVSTILDILQGYMQESGKVNEVEEITENLFLFLTDSWVIETMRSFAKIMEQISLLAKLKVKERASLSSRAIFKYCDIVEKWKC